jgi:flagellar assembly protein FliH
MSSSAEYRIAFPAPVVTPATPRPAFPPPPDQQATVWFGEQVVRDGRAGSAAAARFDVDLRERAALPPDVVRRLHAEAQAAGYAAGWAQGQREARVSAEADAARAAAETQRAAAAQAERAERAVRALSSAAASLERRAVPPATESEDAIVAAAFALATAVLARELTTTAEPGQDAVARALALAPAQCPVTVRLNPADRMTIGTHELVIDGRTVSLVDDPALQPGDAVALCDATTIDARLAPALARAREVLGL